MEVLKMDQGKSLCWDNIADRTAKTKEIVVKLSISFKFISLLFHQQI